LRLKPGGYILVTLHRPSNVDEPEAIAGAVHVMTKLNASVPVVLVAHPRTKGKIEALGLIRTLDEAHVRVLDPLGYTDFMRLVSRSAAVVTDSGGIQEETTVLGIPCITMRTSTERPITITEGTNRLAGVDPPVVVRAALDALSSNATPRRPELWDGRTAPRIVDILLRNMDPPSCPA
jgi:UDP-N-acetylglucosamine 2-epimerase (non-hydrolysing)